MHNIKQTFNEDFAFLEELLRLGFEALGWGAGPQGQGSLRFASPIRGLRMDGLKLVLGLFAKSSKQLRAIMLLCERGLTSDADMIARGLFESLLAIQFLLKPRLTLLENGKPIPPDKKKSLTRSFRASLYDAHLVFQHAKRIAKFKTTPRLKRLAKHLGVQATFVQMENEASREIGPAWTERLKKRKTYSGVSIRDLAESLKVLNWYNSVYDIQSSIAHAADAYQFAGYDLASQAFILDLAPKSDNVRQVLHTASGLFIGVLNTLNTQLRLGFDNQVSAAVQRLKDAGRRLRSAT